MPGAWEEGEEQRQTSRRRPQQVAAPQAAPPAVLAEPDARPRPVLAEAAVLEAGAAVASRIAPAVRTAKAGSPYQAAARHPAGVLVDGRPGRAADWPTASPKGRGRGGSGGGRFAKPGGGAPPDERPGGRRTPGEGEPP